jgi:two-component system, LytTR family, sensor kinase
MKNNASLRWFRFVMIPFLAILLYGSLVLLSPPDELKMYFGKQGIWIMLTEISVAFLFSFVYSECNILISNYLDKKINWNKNPVLRCTVQFLLAFISGSGLGYVALIIFNSVSSHGQRFYSEFYQVLVAGFLIALPITLVFLVFYLFDNWRKTLVESEVLKRENVEAQFEVLKNQLDPHFLFNNLNTLTGIVEENPKKAVDFIQNLSQVYRYVLLNKDKTSVSIAEELKLANAYIFLLQNRFDDCINVNIDIPNTILQHEIPPMTLQMLLENIIKHNVIDSNHQMNIDLFYDELTHSLVLKNDLFPKIQQEVSTKIGIDNINNRLKMNGLEELKVEKNGKDFKVIIFLK